MTPRIVVQREDFDPAAITERLSAASLDIGAVTTFVGLCRSEDGRLSGLELEHYPGMAEEEMGRVAEETARRWPLAALEIVHRYGLVRPGERIVCVGAAASHRGASLDAAAFVMDYLKTRAPFWKREHLADGGIGAWVAPRASDDEAATLWNRQGPGRR